MNSKCKVSNFQILITVKRKQGKCARVKFRLKMHSVLRLIKLPWYLV